MNTFTGGQEYDVTSVSFGIELAQSGNGTGQPLTVNLYANNGSPFPGGDWQSNLIATSGELNIPDQADTIFEVPITATVPAGTLELVMEVMTPDGTGVGNLFFIGSNPDPETGPSYMSAADCGAPDPTPDRRLGLSRYAYRDERQWKLSFWLTPRQPQQRRQRQGSLHRRGRARHRLRVRAEAYGDSESFCYCDHYRHCHSDSQCYASPTEVPRQQRALARLGNQG